MKERISVLSTYATDKLVRSNGEIISEQPGGPIIFLENALRAAQVPYRLYHGEQIDVEILITDEGEFGKIPHPAKPLPLPVDVSDWIIISTLLREWNLGGVAFFRGKVFVDIQGYVRNGNDFGKKMIWEEAKEFAKNIFCLKGTREEVSCLPAEVQKDQKENRLLIATDGRKGLELFYQGEGLHIPTTRVVTPRDTIGAGDTFFGYFVASMYKGSNPEEAARYATDEAIEFLARKGS